MFHPMKTRQKSKGKQQHEIGKTKMKKRNKVRTST